jgi:hypothetical protein
MSENQNISPSTPAPMDGPHYVAPKVFAAARGIKFEVGKKYDLSTMGLGPHPQYGPIPEFEVTEVKGDGSFLAGTIKCAGLVDEPCAETVEVQSGDLFQKRRCETHQRKFARRKQRPGLSDGEKAQREQAREAKKLERLQQKEQEKKVRAEERAQKDKERVEAKLASLKEKEAKLKGQSTPTATPTAA